MLGDGDTRDDEEPYNVSAAGGFLLDFPAAFYCEAVVIKEKNQSWHTTDKKQRNTIQKRTIISRYFFILNELQFC